MKYLTILLLLGRVLVPEIGMAFGIVGNGMTGEDSISISIHLTDSIGNPSGLGADSFYVCIIGPSGDSIRAVSGEAAHTDLHLDSLSTAPVGRTYIYAEAINSIDGDGQPGIYELTFCAKRNTPEYVNCSVTSFQLVETSLNDRLALIGNAFDSILAVLDSLRSQDDWVSSFDPAGDTVTADAVMISNDPATADNLESVLNNSGNVSVKLGRLEISGANGTNQSLSILNSTGTAVLFSSSGSGENDNGLEVASLNGSGLFAGSVNGAGFTAYSLNGSDMMGDITGTVIINDTTVAGDKIGLAPQHWSAADSNAYQGPGSALTLSGIINGVWNEPQSAHITGGTFGRYLDAAVSAAGSPLGTGSYPVTVIAFDSGNAQAVPGTELSVYNSSLDVLLAIGATDNDGGTSFNLDAGSYVVSATAPGYSFDTDHPLTITGADYDTIFGSRFNPGTPASADLCRVYGYFQGIDGQPIEDVQVTAHIAAGVVRHNSTIISPYRAGALTDTNGYFQLDLIPSDELTPAGTKYNISAVYPAGTVMKKKIIVPDLTEWQLSW